MSGPNKFSRGGGRGLNRMVPPPLGRGMVPLRRGQPPGKEKGRPDESSKGRGLALKGNSTGAGSTGGIQGEGFQLVSCREQGALPLYAMAIRLTPGMLETLKRMEELGETSTMKFGVNNSGHVIKVGEEEFRFSSAPEPGELCDIFEEQRRGEDGNGVLVEAGSVWRKLSVIRTLSATDKATVKARSVEAERQQKSRKAIILDHSNSLMNNKAATAGDANGRRAPVMTKLKKEPPQKKRKIVAPVIPPLSAVKTRPMPPMIEKAPVAAATSKMGKATSVSSPPDGPPTSSRPPPSQVLPFKPRGAAAEEVGDAAKTLSMPHKDKLSSPAVGTGAETAAVAKTAGVVNMSELRNCLITLLVDNPKGMTIKAVEKALGEAMPTVRPDKKQIEKVIKAIASYHAPGKYMLKEGVEKGAFAKPSPGSGSSPETAPVDSPPLGDLPALMENAPETQQEIAGAVGSGEDSNVGLGQDLKRTDGTSRNSSLPLRGGESAVSRAIRRAGELVRGNAEKLHYSGLDKSRTVVESSGQNLEDSTLKDLTAGPEIVDADHVSIGGDESPVVGSPVNENDGKFNGMEVEIFDQDRQNSGSPHLLEADNKKNSDGSDSSSSSSSSSESGSDSDSESASGSRSGSGSDTDSDGSTSSASEEENMDEDVDIISDEEEKAGVDVVVTEVLKQKLKSKEMRTSLERQESRVQKQASRAKKQKQKGSDAGMTPHESEDADPGDGAEGGEISTFVDRDATDKGAKVSNSEEEVDVVSSGEDTPSPPNQRIPSPAESGEHNNNEIGSDLELQSNVPSMEEVKGGQGSLHGAVPTRSGSESDHSIEEYETRAETSGVRGARVKVIGEQKDDTLERKIEGIPSVISIRSKGSGGTKGLETPRSVERGSKIEVAGISPTWKGSDLADGPMMSKEHLVSSGVPLRSDIQQRSLLGTPPVPRDGLDQVGARVHREATVKAKAIESKRKGLSKNVETGEIQEKALIAHRGPQRFRKMIEPPVRTAKFTEVSLKPPGEGETHSKAADGLPKPSDARGLIGKGPESRETSTADRSVKSSRDGDTLERHDVHRRRNREAGLLAKPGNASELNKDKHSNLLGKPGRDFKQAKKPVEKLDGLKRAEPSERTITGSEFGEKLTKDTDIQRRLSRDGECWPKSPKGTESGSRIGSDNEVHSARLKDLQKSDTDQSEAAKVKVSRMTSDLELGELRDIVAGEELRPKDSLRQENLKLKEGSDLLSRQLQNKLRVSPDKDKPRNTGKLGDVKKPSPADPKKQQLTKKELPKADIPVPSRDTVWPALSGQKFGGGHDDKLEMGHNRAGEAPRTFGDHNEKHIEGRNGKRLADDSGNHDLGRPFKRTVFEQSHAAATSGGRGETDTTTYKSEKGSFVVDAAARTSAQDIGKSNFADGGNQLAANSSKLMGNGPVLGPKSKGQEVVDKDVVDKRGFGFDCKQKSTAGLLGPGSKKETQSNGKKRSSQPGDAQSREFFAPYEKRAAEVKGPILQYDQYREYWREYGEKYPVYFRLNTILESDKEDFETFSRDIALAKTTEDKNKLGQLYGKVRKDYRQCSKRYKRMLKVFFILHDELKVIKQRCKEYCDKVAPRIVGCSTSSRRSPI